MWPFKKKVHWFSKDTEIKQQKVDLHFVYEKKYEFYNPNTDYVHVCYSCKCMKFFEISIPVRDTIKSKAIGYSKDDFMKSHIKCEICEKIA